MKRLLILLMLASTTAYAQQYQYDVRKSIDKFDGTIYYCTTIGMSNMITLCKIIKKQDTVYYIEFRTAQVYNFNYDQSPLIFLFNDDSKATLEEVNSDVEPIYGAYTGYKYKVWAYIRPDKIGDFTTKSISYIRYRNADTEMKKGGQIKMILSYLTKL